MLHRRQQFSILQFFDVRNDNYIIAYRIHMTFTERFLFEHLIDIFDGGMDAHGFQVHSGVLVFDDSHGGFIERALPVLEVLEFDHEFLLGQYLLSFLGRFVHDYGWGTTASIMFLLSKNSNKVLAFFVSVVLVYNYMDILIGGGIFFRGVAAVNAFNTSMKMYILA